MSVRVDKKTKRQLVSQSSCSFAAAESRLNYSSDKHFKNEQNNHILSIIF